MTDLISLLRGTGAYKTIKGDKDLNRLSHAYLLLTADGANLDAYLKIFAQIISCKDGAPCGACRSCTLIQDGKFADVLSYPRESSSVVADDVSDLISESYIKPIESDKKIFLLSHAETMNAAAQNKLLKTLEEPPKNVHIIIGATSEYPLLSTVKSRVRKLEIPSFSAEKLFSAMKEEFTDHLRLRSAIACGDGTVGKAAALYSDDNLKEALSLAEDTIVNMKSSSDVLEYSTKITSLKTDLSEFLSVLELILRDMLVCRSGREDLASNRVSLKKTETAVNFSEGALINALEKVTEAFERKKFNANPTMLIEWLLFQILEGKYKWQKL